MTLDSIITIIKKIADISLVWLAIYYILKNIRNNVKLTLLFKGVAIILILKLVSNWLGLATIGLLLEYVIMWGPLALIIIFQPEIRNVLEQLGKTQLLGRHKVLTVDERERLVYEIVNAVEYLRKARIGALIVLERDISLANYIEKAKKVYADLSSDLEKTKDKEKYEYWLDAWLHAKRLGVKESTYIRYRNTIENHIKPDLGVDLPVHF